VKRERKRERERERELLSGDTITCRLKEQKLNEELYDGR
jgi:hypothetical protein